MADKTVVSPWAEQVSQALADVDSLNAAALRLVYHGRLTQAEAARKLGLAESELKARVSAGLRQLGGLLRTSVLDS